MLSRFHFNTSLASILLCLCLVLSSFPAMAQSALQKQLSQPVSVSASNKIKHQGDVYTLWGTSALEVSVDNYNFLQDAIGKLRNHIASQDLNCFIHAPKEAQCFNEKNEDIALFMLRNGFVFPDRSEIAGTRYEKPYLNAVRVAQDNGSGIWKKDDYLLDAITSLKSHIKQLTVFAFAFFILSSICFIVVVLINKRSADRTYMLIDNAIQILSREAKIHQREIDLTAIMVHSELKNNLAKIEAYLVIYQDLYNTLKDPYADHRYTKAGEVVRSAPALDRYIFDANVDKLDALGEDIIPQLVKLYSRLDSDPPYSNLEPDMELDYATNIVEGVVINAQSLRSEVTELIEMCDKKGFVSANLTLSN